MAQETEHKVIHDDEIDLVDLIKTIWSGRMFILKSTAIACLLGVIIAFASPVEYTSSCTLLPESQKSNMKNLGGFAGLAGLAGVDLGSLSGGGVVLKPDLYPALANSLPFMLEIMNDTIYFEKLNLRMTSYYYFKEIEKPTFFDYIKRYTIGLPKKIKGWLSEEAEPKDFTSDFYRISKADWKIIENFRNRISINVKDKKGVIEVDIKMPDPYAAAEIAKKIEVKLTQAVIDYKTNKAVKNLEFVENAYKEAKARFENMQKKLAIARDRNAYVNTSMGKIGLEKIEHEFDLAFEVYKGLATQVEQAKIGVKEETPVFTVLEPVRVPNDKASPKRGMMLMISLLLGVLLSSIYILIKKHFLTSFISDLKIR